MLSDQRKSVKADPTDQEHLDAEIKQLTEVWREIEDMPTWPIDRRIRKRFAWNHVIVLVPVVLKALSTPAWWQDLANAITKVFS